MSTIPSNGIQVFPGCRRDAGQYSSRLLTDENLTRFNRVNFLQDQLDLSSDVDTISGNAILGYKKADHLDFCLGGYYFHVTDDTVGGLLNTVDNLTSNASSADKSLFVYIDLAEIQVDNPNISDTLWELVGTDTNNVYNGLNWSETFQPHSGALNEKRITMQLLIPGNTVGYVNCIFNPKFTMFKQSCVTATEAKNYFQFGNNQPYFISSTDFAKGDFSNKNKIWIDNMYYIPHVYSYNLRTSSTEKKWEWVPLGAVYKPLGKY